MPKEKRIFTEKAVEKVVNMSVDLKMILAVLALAAGGLTSFVVMQRDVAAQTTDTAELTEVVDDVEDRVGDLEVAVVAQGKKIENLAVGINYTGEALQAIAEKLDVDLPNRPIVVVD